MAKRLQENSPILFLILAICACFSLKAQQTLYSFEEQTNVRQEANINSPRIDKLMAGEEVYSLSERSNNKTTISIAGKSIDGVWLKIVTQSGKQGWVHEALLLDKAPETNYYTWVDQLRVRTEPKLSATVLELLPINTTVQFSGERSIHEERIKLRGQNESFYWMKISSPSGKSGWVYGGGLKLGNNNNDPVSINIDPNPNPNPLPNPNIDNQDAQALLHWWHSLKPEWKTYFNERVLKKDILDLYKTPNTTELKKIKSLKELDLSSNDECNTGPFYSVPLKDFSGLSELTALEKLYCDYVSFDNLLPLTNLPQLRTLSIRESNFNSLAGLDKLQHLNWLDISIKGSTPLDISLLKGLNNLEELYLESNKIEDLNALRSLLKLRKLIIKCPSIKSSLGVFEKNGLLLYYCL